MEDRINEVLFEYAFGLFGTLGLCKEFYARRVLVQELIDVFKEYA